MNERKQTNRKEMLEKEKELMEKNFTITNLKSNG